MMGEPATARQLLREASVLLRHFPDPGILPAQIDELQDAIASRGAREGALVTPLTNAELRVFRYFPTHLSYQGIAEDLHVSRNTVKSQALAIYRKLGVTSRREAVSAGRELGLLDSAV